MFVESDLQSRGWKEPVWLVLLVVASIAFTFALACATPFAAFAAIAACTLPRRDAYGLAAAVWLANQGVGFGFLHFPLTVNCFSWGAALGVTALLSTLAARQTLRQLTSLWTPVRILVAFLTAFAAYEVALIGFSLVLGGIENFTLAIQSEILKYNAVAMGGLLALDRLGVAIGLAPTFRRPSSVSAQHG